MSPSIKLVILALAIFVLFRCGNDVNPYLARADSGPKIVAGSFADGDTLSIFSTESLSVTLHLKEYIDHCAFRTGANRFWSGIDTVIPATSFDQRLPLTLMFSFYDTGWQTITFTTYRTMGDSVAKTLSVYTKSPLSQVDEGTNINFMLQVLVTPSGSGTVVRTVSGVANPGPYEAGTTVTLEARPATGYSMGHWSGPVIVSADSAIVNVHMDSSVNAQVTFTIAPPVITVQPIDAKVTKGQRASFRLTASGVNLTYQWKRNDNTIPEATSATYTTPVLTVSSSGVHYRCVVSNPAGSVTSREAVVIVAK